MEPITVDIDAAIQGFGVILLIPVVVFALGSEYFIRHVNMLTVKKPKLDRNIELEKVRMSGVFVILFQFTVFLGSPEIRESSPVLCQLIFISVVLLQLWVQSRVEKEIRPNPPGNADDFISLAFRAVTSWMMGIFLYGVVLLAAIKIASMVADHFQASTLVSASILLLGGLVGVSLGLALNFACGSFHIRRMFPTSILENPELKTRLESCFTRAGLHTPKLRIIELHELRIASIIMSGFHHGTGIFQPTLFISRTTLNALTLDEVEALVLTQVSHVALKHLRKRLVWSLGLGLFATFLAILSVVVGQTFLFSISTLEEIVPAVALASFFMSIRFLSGQNRAQELEADLYSIRQLKSSVKNLEAALRKLDPPPEEFKDIDPLAYNPEMERRIELIKTQIAPETLDVAKAPSEDDRAA